MIDRRGFLIATSTAAVLPSLPAEAASVVEETPPDPWELQLRDMERHIRLVRENRARIAEMETTIVSEQLRIDMQYLHSEIIDHCARVTLQLAQECRWEAQRIMESAYVKKGRPDAARYEALPHPRDRHM